MIILIIISSHKIKLENKGSIKVQKVCFFRRYLVDFFISNQSVLKFHLKIYLTKDLNQIFTQS